MMFSTESHSSADADWRQLEEFVDRLHGLARAQVTAETFYQELLTGCVTLLAADGGAVWLPAGRGQWRSAYQINTEKTLADAATNAAHASLLQTIAVTTEPKILPPQSSGTAEGENPTDLVLAFATIHDASHHEQQAIVELMLRPGSSPAVQQGWLELLTTLQQLAAEFHVYSQLRALRSERELYDQSHSLSRRFQQSVDLQKTAFEIVNEGRKFAACDRLSLVVRQGKTWRLLAASGVDRIEKRADVTKRLQMLATATAHWGEPLDYADSKCGESSTEGLPPTVVDTLQQHVDESQARRLVAVPIEYVQQQAESEKKQQANPPSAVLIAEQFSNEASDFSQQRIIELAQLCEPALRQAAQLDRFPIRSCLRWVDRWSRLSQTWGMTKLTFASLALAAAICALVFVKSDYEIEAPATLAPIVQRDIFATTDGKVVEVKVAHGEQVVAGDILATLHDPQLALDTQRVLGEIETTRKQIESLTVARTDRRTREDTTKGQLPLAAEAEQLKKRLASLKLQQEILQQRREALTLRSPIAGTLLTLDVQNLLQTRPVQRGQVLFTIADASGGWRLLADVPQDRIGQVVVAQQSQQAELPVRFRLAGDTENIFEGRVASISTTAVLDTDGLDQESPTIEVVVAVDDQELSTARPGMNAQVRIHCGKRSLGYLWLHDIWETIYSWVVF